MRAAIAIALLSTAAGAYPSMIRHGYTQCGSCHTDPSGGTLLNEYGRAQSELLLSSRWGARDDDEPSSRSKFLFGAVPTPANTVLGGWLRNGYIWNVADGKLVDHRALQMRGDLAADVRLGALRASGQLGYAGSGAALATIKRDASVVSREHWIGLSFASEAGLVRAGRLNLPFGLRNPEHTSFVRSATQTDFNQDQQYGAAIAFAGESWRAEGMAILGNYSLQPDAFRERGFAAQLEAALSPAVALGLSALLTRAEAALDGGVPTLRQAYAITARVAPWKPLVVLAELDALVASKLGNSVRAGQAGWIQADVEILRGFHVLSALEDLRPATGGSTQVGAWGGLQWFVIPHLDMRADWVRRSSVDTWLIQLNGYL